MLKASGYVLWYDFYRSRNTSLHSVPIQKFNSFSRVWRSDIYNACIP